MVKAGYTLALTSALVITSACKRTTISPQAVTTTGKPPVVVKSGVDGPEIAYGFHFRSTITGDYAITQDDCGFALRANSDKPISFALPLLPFPCALMLYNNRTGLVTVNITQQAPDGTGGDFNGDRSFTLGQGHGAILHVNQSSAFYRGVYTCKAGTCGGGATPPPQPAGASSYSDLTDFKVTQDSPKKLTVSPGAFAIGSYSFPSASGGSVEFTAGSGPTKIYMSKLGILTTEAPIATTAVVTGQMILLTASEPSFPPGSIPIADLTLSNAVATLTHTGLASRVRNTALEAGPGVMLTYTQGVARISVDATVARSDAPGSTTASTSTAVAAWSGLLLASAALILLLGRRQ